MTTQSKRRQGTTHLGALICMRARSIVVDDPPSPPTVIEWEQLSPADIEAMPVLGELWSLKSGHAGA